MYSGSIAATSLAELFPPARAEPLALDTEFMRVDTYYPAPALVQMTRTRVLLLDPLAVAGPVLRRAWRRTVAGGCMPAPAEDVEALAPSASNWPGCSTPQTAAATGCWVGLDPATRAGGRTQ